MAIKVVWISILVAIVSSIHANATPIYAPCVIRPIVEIYPTQVDCSTGRFRLYSHTNRENGVLNGTTSSASTDQTTGNVCVSFNDQFPNAFGGVFNSTTVAWNTSSDLYRTIVPGLLGAIHSPISGDYVLASNDSTYSTGSTNSSTTFSNGMSIVLTIFRPGFDLRTTIQATNQLLQLGENVIDINATHATFRDSLGINVSAPTLQTARQYITNLVTPIDTQLTHHVVVSVNSTDLRVCTLTTRDVLVSIENVANASQGANSLVNNETLICGQVEYANVSKTNFNEYIRSWLTNPTTGTWLRLGSMDPSPFGITRLAIYPLAMWGTTTDSVRELFQNQMLGNIYPVYNQDGISIAIPQAVLVGDSVQSGQCATTQSSITYQSPISRLVFPVLTSSSTRVHNSIGIESVWGISSVDGNGDVIHAINATIPSARADFGDVDVTFTVRGSLFENIPGLDYPLPTLAAILTEIQSRPLISSSTVPIQRCGNGLDYRARIMFGNGAGVVLCRICLYESPMLPRLAPPQPINTNATVLYASLRRGQSADFQLPWIPTPESINRFASGVTYMLSTIRLTTNLSIASISDLTETSLLGTLNARAADVVGYPIDVVSATQAQAPGVSTMIGFYPGVVVKYLPLTDVDRPAYSTGVEMLYFDAISVYTDPISGMNQVIFPSQGIANASGRVPLDPSFPHRFALVVNWTSPLFGLSQTITCVENQRTTFVTIPYGSSLNQTTSFPIILVFYRIVSWPLNGQLEFSEPDIAALDRQQHQPQPWVSSNVKVQYIPSSHFFTRTNDSTLPYRPFPTSAFGFNACPITVAPGCPDFVQFEIGILRNSTNTSIKSWFFETVDSQSVALSDERGVLFFDVINAPSSLPEPTMTLSSGFSMVLNAPLLLDGRIVLNDLDQGALQFQLILAASRGEFRYDVDAAQRRDGTVLDASGLGLASSSCDITLGRCASPLSFVGPSIVINRIIQYTSFAVTSTSLRAAANQLPITSNLVDANITNNATVNQPSLSPSGNAGRRRRLQTITNSSVTSPGYLLIFVLDGGGSTILYQYNVSYGIGTVAIDPTSSSVDPAGTLNVFTAILVYVMLSVVFVLFAGMLSLLVCEHNKRMMTKERAKLLQLQSNNSNHPPNVPGGENVIFTQPHLTRRRIGHRATVYIPIHTKNT